MIICALSKMLCSHVLGSFPYNLHSNCRNKYIFRRNDKVSTHHNVHSNDSHIDLFDNYIIQTVKTFIMMKLTNLQEYSLALTHIST